MCTATLGVKGPTCGRPATGVDQYGRAVCDLRLFHNVYAHSTRVHPGLSPEAPVAADPPPAEPVAPPVAKAAQDPPKGEPASSEDPAAADEPLTLGAARALGVTIANDVSEAVARVVKEHCGAAASMAQDPAVAAHPAGLCDDGKCSPCRSQRRDEHLQGRRLFADELDRSIEWTGRGKAGEMLARDGSDALGEMVEGWRDAGRPVPDAEPPKQIQVVPG